MFASKNEAEALVLPAQTDACALVMAMLLEFSAFTYDTWDPAQSALRRTARTGAAYISSRNVYYGSLLAMGTAPKVHILYCTEDGRRPWAWLLFGSSVSWYWSFQISKVLHRREHKCAPGRPLLVDFPSLQPGN